MRATDVYAASNISASTAVFSLAGGKYGVDYIATWNSGSVTLERQAGDGSTFVAAMTAFSASGYAVADLPAGNYKLVIGGSPSAIYVTVKRIPGE